MAALDQISDAIKVANSYTDSLRAAPPKKKASRHLVLLSACGLREEQLLGSQQTCWAEVAS